MTITEAFAALRVSDVFVRPAEGSPAAAVGLFDGITVWCYSEKSGIRTSRGAVPLARVTSDWIIVPREHFISAWKIKE